MQLMLIILNQILYQCYQEVHNQITSNMGLSNGKEKKKFEINQDDDLEFYTDVLDPNLGPVKIYTSRKFHLCYILKYEKNQDDTKIYNIFKKVESSQLSPLLSLHGFNIERKNCCNRICSQKITSYWEYYNFYFNDYLVRRRQQGLTLIDSQIWHILQVCCQTYNIFRKFGIYYQISPQTFVITPEGKLKAFWCHLRSQNHHMKFFQYFDNNHKINRFPYSPQQLECMHQQERTTKIDFDKSNTYRMGILLLQCLSLADPLANCYNPSMTAINSNSIKNLIFNKVVPNYPAELVNLLRNLLREDPHKRPTLTEVYEQYSNRFSPQFQLRVCGIRAAESLNNHQDDLFQIQQFNKASDFSDAKTVKFNSLNKRN